MRRPAKTCVFLLLLCLAALPAAPAQENQHRTIAPRPLTRHEGLVILQVALDSRHHAHSSDCSHLVHTLYQRAGFPYDYAPSSDLYAGIEGFRRVAHPQAGDLAVWPGHAGIVVNPAQHSFFSMLSSGPGIDFYDSPYWKQRGRPHFFRYLETAPTGILSSSLRTPNLKP